MALLDFFGVLGRASDSGADDTERERSRTEFYALLKFNLERREKEFLMSRRHIYSKLMLLIGLG